MMIIAWLWTGHVGVQLSWNEGALFGIGQGQVWLFVALRASVASRTWVKGQPQVSTAQTVRDATEAECPAEVLPSEAVDVCPNITGDQAAVPEGYSMKNGKCVEDEVKGVETEKPEPTIRPVVNEPPEVVPTAVDAGQVGITYVGHSTFRIESPGGITVATASQSAEEAELGARSPAGRSSTGRGRWMTS